ncbi:MAG: hypothetical protein JO340_19110 [Acidobacteriaceae bacterium]|nr:hypothetical protein [Acidobacteriaceae bacterium]
MRFYTTSIALALLIPATLCAQSARRIAVIAANGPLERANPIFALGEDRVTEALKGKLADLPGITLVAQGDLDTILKTQNLQNSDRASADTASRIGRILNAEGIVLVNLVNGSQTQHQENTRASAKTVAVVEAEASARLVNVESGATIAQPSSTFKESAVAVEIKTFPVYKTSGQGLPATFNDLWTKATESLTSDLASKLKDALSQVSPASNAAAALASDPPKVIGIDNGNVFLNKGSNAGIKLGDRFQIVRNSPTSLKNDDGTPILNRQKVCTLKIDTLSPDGKNASGACPGGVPQPKDQAEPFQP